MVLTFNGGFGGNEFSDDGAGNDFSPNVFAGTKYNAKNNFDPIPNIGVPAFPPSNFPTVWSGGFRLNATVELGIFPSTSAMIGSYNDFQNIRVSSLSLVAKTKSDLPRTAYIPSDPTQYGYYWFQNLIWDVPINLPIVTIGNVDTPAGLTASYVVPNSGPYKGKPFPQVASLVWYSEGYQLPFYNTSIKPVAFLGGHKNISPTKRNDGQNLDGDVWQWRVEFADSPKPPAITNTDDVLMAPDTAIYDSREYRPNNAQIIRTAPIIAYDWHVWEGLSDGHWVRTQGKTLDKDFETQSGTRTVYLTITAEDGSMATSQIQVTRVESATMGAVAHPNGSLYHPGATANGVTPIMRFTEGAGMPATLSSVPLKSVHLIRHETTLYAGGVAASGIGQLWQSDDEGAIFNMIGAALPSGYKAIDWLSFDNGDFGVLATNGTGLYTARSKDGGEWSAPLLVYTAPSGTPKGFFRQMTPTKESHTYITDGTNYSFRNDDYLQSKGTRIY